MLKNKCGINATKVRPLATISSEKASNQSTYVICIISLEGGCQDNNIWSRNVAHVIMSQHSSSNIICEIPDVGEQDARNIPPMNLSRVLAAERVEEGLQLGGLHLHPARLPNIPHT